MATLISASTFGIYIVEEQNGQIAANTPGGIDLDSLSLGDTYIDLSTIVGFQIQMHSEKEGEKVTGWKIIQTANTGTMSGSVFGGAHVFYKISALINATYVGHLQTLYRKHLQRGDGVKYLVFQIASTTFIPFSLPAGTAKNYAEIAIRSVEITFDPNMGPQKWTANITCEAIQDRN